MSPRIVTVVGATGQQGQAVVNAFINNPAFKVRGLTSNTGSDAAKKLVATGAEVVKFDINDEKSIQAAFSGSNIIYAVADFWALYQQHGIQKAKAIEYEQGAAMARAAGKVQSLEHYIWSTLPKSTPEYPVYHFDAKHDTEAVIKADPALLAKTTFMVVCFYANNLNMASMRPYWLDSIKKYVQFVTYPLDTPIPFIGEVANVTPFVQAIVEKPGQTQNGTYVIGATAQLTAKEWMDMWAKEQNAEIELITISKEDNSRLFPQPRWAEEWALMMDYFYYVPVNQWLDEGSNILTAEALSITPAVTMEQWVKSYKLPDASKVLN